MYSLAGRRRDFIFIKKNRKLWTDSKPVSDSLLHFRKKHYLLKLCKDRRGGQEDIRELWKVEKATSVNQERK